MHVIRHHVTFLNPAPLLLRKPSKYLAKILANLPEYRLLAVPTPLRLKGLKSNTPLMMSRGQSFNWLGQKLPCEKNAANTMAISSSSLGSRSHDLPRLRGI